MRSGPARRVPRPWAGARSRESAGADVAEVVWGSVKAIAVARRAGNPVRALGRAASEATGGDHAVFGWSGQAAPGWWMHARAFAASNRRQEAQSVIRVTIPLRARGGDTCEAGQVPAAEARRTWHDSRSSRLGFHLMPQDAATGAKDQQGGVAAMHLHPGVNPTTQNTIRNRKSRQCGSRRAIWPAVGALVFLGLAATPARAASHYFSNCVQGGAGTLANPYCMDPDGSGKDTQGGHVSLVPMRIGFRTG